MASDSMNESPAADSPAWQARRLLRAARGACLATSAKGQPFASLVTPGVMSDGSLLLLLSRLAEHTRHLMADPRCSVMASGVAETANPQTTPRITVTGVAEVVEDAAMKARYLAIHPYAELYAGFGDFATWRIVPQAGVLVGGFARAFRLKAAELGPDAVSREAVLAAEAGVLAHMNADHADALAAIAGAPARMVTCDVDGFDVLIGEGTRRVAWAAPVTGADGVRAELVRLAKQARGGA